MLSKEEWEDSFRNLPTRVLFNVILDDGIANISKIL